MSVQVNQYLGYGYLMDYNEAYEKLHEMHGEEQAEKIRDDYHDSAYSKEVQEINGCSMIVDGCNGQYVFFGKVFAKSENYEHLPTQAMPRVSTKVKKQVESQMQILFGSSQVKPQLTLLTHYR